MKDRKGEKIGWVGGWTGGFIWVILLSVIWLFQGKLLLGLSGLGLFLATLYLIIAFKPWKYPETRYWKLMLPIYAIFLFALSLFVLISGGFGKIGLKWWQMFWLIPVFIPFITAGKRCWKDGNASDRLSEDKKI